MISDTCFFVIIELYFFLRVRKITLKLNWPLVLNQHVFYYRIFFFFSWVVNLTLLDNSLTNNLNIEKNKI